MSEEFNLLAFKYFNGSITGEEERRLFSEIQSAEGKKAFSLAEEEWLSSQEAVLASEKPWQRIRQRMEIRDSGNHFAPSKAKRPNFWAVATVAAAIVIACMGVFLLREPKMEYFTFESPSGARSRVLLPDSSVVWLNSGSKLVLANSFGSTQRKLDLLGEAYFDVARNENLPFVVHAGACDITVLGTKFNVTSYDEDNFIRTSVAEGKVAVSDGTHAVRVSKGQSVEYSKSTSSFTRKQVSISSIAAWTENRMEYADITLRDFADIVARTYNIPIVFLSEKYADEHLSISLRNNELLVTD